MNKRDFAAEIIGRRSRTLKRGARWDHFSARFDRVIDGFEFLEDHKDAPEQARQELLKYIPIGLIACTESYFRSAMRDLIDFGAPYDDNARKLESSRLDLSTVLDIGKKRISVGEFVSHVIHIRNLQDINRSMSVILSLDFLDNLKATYNDALDDTPEKIIGDIIRDVEQTFMSRHIFCHEYAVAIRPSIDEMFNLIGAILIFTYTAEAMIGPLLEK